MNVNPYLLVIQDIEWMGAPAFSLHLVIYVLLRKGLEPVTLTQTRLPRELV